MKTKNILLFAFFTIAIIQLAVPFQMISHNNDLLETGKLYKFKTQPIDPYDPFRGKYIHLNFEENQLLLSKEIDIRNDVYALLTTKNGFAKVHKISTEEPQNGDFIKVKASSIYESGGKYQIWLDFPFNRFYMNEYKAPKAEKTYNQAVTDIKNNVYALVAVKKGEAIVKDVIINNVSIKKYNPKK